MTALPPPAGRRDNGLPSAEWGALVDLDPRLSAALLDSLAAEGVAAYVEPARDLDSYTRAAVLPSRPLDRLWVDPACADLARGIVASEVADLSALLAEQEPGANAHGLVRPVPHSAATRVLPPPVLPEPTRPPEQLTEPAPSGPSVSPLAPPVAGGNSPSDDELFAQIVAGFAQQATDPVARWPVSEDLEQDGQPVADSMSPRAESWPAPRRRRSDSEDAGLPSWVEPEALEDEGHFEPPPAPRIPRLRPRTVLATTMVLLGLAILFAPYRIGLDDSIIYMVLGLLLTAGGAGLLVAWMRDAPSTDGGPDDGAVV